MKQPIKSGDLAKIIDSVDGINGHSVGKVVTVGKLMGEHSIHGIIWRVHGTDLISEYGGTGDSVDCAAAWLKKIEPPPVSPSQKKEKLELVK